MNTTRSGGRAHRCSTNATIGHCLSVASRLSTVYHALRSTCPRRDDHVSGSSYSRVPAAMNGKTLERHSRVLRSRQVRYNTKRNLEKLSASIERGLLEVGPEQERKEYAATTTKEDGAHIDRALGL
eukprot:6181569-Pleurochrysis_carterae.AAC.3